MKFWKVVLPFIVGLGLALGVVWSFGQPTLTQARSMQRPSLATHTVGSSPNCNIIQQCIDNATAGDTIIVPADTYIESIILNKAVSLIGVGSEQTILQAPADERVLEITGAAINNTTVISGLTITGGRADNGGGIIIRNPAQPLIQNVVISNNQAQGATELSGFGGGIYVEFGLAPTRLTLLNSTLLDNSATQFGGGVFVSDEATITGGRFEGNEATFGGGIVAGPLNLNNVDIISNTATDGGGAYVIGEATVIDTRFEDNEVISSGAGILTSGFLNVAGSDFINNRAGQDGGGAFVAAGQTGGVLGAARLDQKLLTVAAQANQSIIENSRFEGNRAGENGAGLMAFDTFTLKNSDFISNTAAKEGGGAVMFHPDALGTAFVEGGRFETNRASVGAGLTVVGTLLLTDTEFVGNDSEEDAGGVAVLQGDATVTGGHFEQNKAGIEGGGMKIDKALTLTNSDFISNTSGFSGGGVYVFGATRISGGRFQGNMASDDGGGIIISNTLTLTDTIFISNTTTNLGGGLIVFEAATVTGARFENNQAAVEGGGLNAQSSLLMQDSVFVGNRSGLNGGGAIVLDPATIRGGRFEANETGLNGGGLFTEKQLTLTGTEFVGNKADGGGGLSPGGVTHVTDARFEANEGRIEGGGLFSVGTLSVTDTLFIDNKADSAGGGAYTFEAATMSGVRFESNQATVNGGGLFALDQVSLTDTDFVNNMVGIAGGGAIAFNEITVTGGMFEGNFCTDLLLECFGGGLLVSGADGKLTLDGTQFINNRAFAGGGLLYEGQEAGIINALFARNQAEEGTSLAINALSQVDILHNTIADTSANPGQAINVIRGVVDVGNTIIVNHSVGISQTGGTISEDYNLFFNTPLTTVGTVASGGQSFSADPVFVNIAQDNYQLNSDSPAIDRAVEAGVASDLLGTPRPQGDGPDIGAYEWSAHSGNVYLPFIIKK